MLSLAIRSQARSSLFTSKIARTATVSVSQKFSSLALRTAAVAQRASPPLSRALSGSIARTFEQRPHKVGLGVTGEPNPPSRVLFVGNLPWSATKEELQEFFTEFGDVTNVRIRTHVDGRPRGFAHIEFASQEQAVACFTSAMEEPLFLGGRDLVVDYAKDFSQAMEPNNRLYFQGCLEGEEVLKDVFSAHIDNIISIYFLRDGIKGTRLPNGFVEFKSVGTATEALDALNGAKLPDGNLLNLQFARAPRPKQPREMNPRLGNNRREKYTNRSWSE